MITFTGYYFIGWGIFILGYLFGYWYLNNEQNKHKCPECCALLFRCKKYNEWICSSQKCDYVKQYGKSN